jgi:BlaI family penicillinase repressor
MERIKISEAEWQVMNVLWEKGAVPASLVVEVLEQEKGWRSRTTRTLLERLVKKKAVHVKPGEKASLYLAHVSMAQALRQESRSFMDRVFGGEPAPMLLHLVEEAKLSKEDIQKLKEILRKKEK